MPPKNRKVLIHTGHPNGDLTLVPKGTRYAHKADTITWEIQNNSGVKSITNIILKPGEPDIFVAPPYKNGNIWTAEIKNRLPLFASTEYAIYWKDEQDNDKICDPKITILPSVVAIESFVSEKIIAIIIIGILGILTIALFNKKKKKSARKYQQ